MPVEENMALARRFLEAHVKGDLDAVDEMLASDFVGHTKLFPGQEPGREGVKWATARLSAAISNVSIFVEDQVAPRATRWLPASACAQPTIEESLWALRLPAGR